MKKLLSFLFLFVLLIACSLKAKALTFEEAYNDQKPMLILVYAEWADNYSSYLNTFNALEGAYGDKFNFVALDIAKADAKAFNARYHIYPNLPYMLMFRDNGKVSRYIQRDCILNESCVNSRLKSFIHQ